MTANCFIGLEIEMDKVVPGPKFFFSPGPGLGPKFFLTRTSTKIFLNRTGTKIFFLDRDRDQNIFD